MVPSHSIHSTRLVRFVTRRGWLALGGILCLAGLPSSWAEDEPEPRLETLRGQLAWFDAAGERIIPKRGKAPAPARIALVDRDHREHAILADPRGRGFALDPRLLAYDFELLVRRLADRSVQVIRVYTWHGARKYEFDYWCDICAIPMFELKECECCQGPIRFRERLVEGDRTTSQERARP